MERNTPIPMQGMELQKDVKKAYQKPIARICGELGQCQLIDLPAKPYKIVPWQIKPMALNQES